MRNSSNRLPHLLQRPPLCAVLVGLKELLNLGFGDRLQALLRFLLEVLRDGQIRSLGRVLDHHVADHLLEHIPAVLVHQLRDPRALAGIRCLPPLVDFLEGDLLAANLRHHRILRRGRGLFGWSRLGVCTGRKRQQQDDAAKG